MKRECLWLVLICCLYFGSAQSIHSQNAYELAEEALQYGNYEIAIQYLGNIAPTGKTLIRLGYAYSQLGRYADAKHTYQEVLRLVKTEDFGQQAHVLKAQAFIGLGYITYQQGKYDDAIEYYTNVVKQGTVGVSKALHNLGRIYAGRGELEKAIATQQQAISGDPDFADAFFQLGVLYSRKQDWQKAITAFQKTITLSPKLSNTHYQLARCYRQVGEVRKAKTSMERFRALEKADTDIQKHLEAVFSADAANKVEALVKLANTYLKYERYVEATRTFKRINSYRTTNIDRAQVSAGLGRIALEQGDITQAITHYKRAIKLGLKTVEIYHYLGIAFMQNRDAQNAISQFQHALAIDADFPDSHLMLGTLYTTTDKFDKAERHYERAIVLMPKMAAAHHGLAYLYGQHNRNIKQAIEHARKAVVLSSNSAPYHNTLSWVLYKNGDYDAAETAVLKAIELDPDNSVYQEGLKEIREQRK